MHALVIDSETGAVLIDEELHGDEPAENPNCVGTYVGPGQMFGPVYHGVRVWVAPAARVYDWEDEVDHVFIQWVDESNSRDAAMVTEKLHTVERSLPGGGVARFLITVG
jgi:hypothetical protein